MAQILVVFYKYYSGPLKFCYKIISFLFPTSILSFTKQLFWAKFKQLTTKYVWPRVNNCFLKRKREIIIADNKGTENKYRRSRIISQGCGVVYRPSISYRCLESNTF